MNHEPSWANIKYHLNVLKSTFPQTSSWKDQQPDPNCPPLPPLEPDLSWTHWEDTNPLVKFVIFVCMVMYGLCMVYVWFMHGYVWFDSAWFWSYPQLGSTMEYNCSNYLCMGEVSAAQPSGLTFPGAPTHEEIATNPRQHNTCGSVHWRAFECYRMVPPRYKLVITPSTSAYNYIILYKIISIIHFHTLLLISSALYLLLFPFDQRCHPCTERTYLRLPKGMRMPWAHLKTYYSTIYGKVTHRISKGGGK